MENLLFSYWHDSREFQQSFISFRRESPWNSGWDYPGSVMEVYFDANNYQTSLKGSKK
jgi:hypothetical protein